MLILDNHDDFGGHAKRNEHTVGDDTIPAVRTGVFFRAALTTFRIAVTTASGSVSLSSASSAAWLPKSLEADNIDRLVLMAESRMIRKASAH